MCLLLLMLTLLSSQSRKSPFDKWEKEIQSHEKRLTKTPPTPGGIFFAGSSSIVRWDVEKSFPDLPVVKVGFGGSQIADSTHFASRLIYPYAPSLIVFYAGDNDLAAGKSPEQVLGDFKAFVAAVHGKLPTTRILFLSIKPSIARWKNIEKIRKANSLVAEMCKKSPQLGYIDLDAPMLDADGEPRAELFAKDGLHLSKAGYDLWTGIVRKHLPVAKKE